MTKNTQNLAAAKATLADYDAKILRLETELMGLKATREKIAQSIQFLEDVMDGESIEPTPIVEVAKPARSKLNLQEKIIIVLKEADREGLETEDIKAAMEHKWPHEPVKISSLRTNLSTLRGEDKIITRDKKKWRFDKGYTP